jgi:hypothetical protein
MITCANDTTAHTVTAVDTVGTDGFSASDLQFGKISNLSVLEHSNYIYYAIKIPKSDGGRVSLGVGYSDVDGDGVAFKIYVPSKTTGGEVETEADGSIKTLLFEDAATLENIRAIETDNDSTFLSYTCALSETAPDAFADIDALDALFGDTEAMAMNDVDADGAPIPRTLTVDTASLGGDYYYAYIKLEPTMSLYKHFIDYLWNNMPFFLAYEIRVTLEVLPTAA